MANYKNRKPKSFKGCCGMCCLRSTDGRRNGRKRTKQEVCFYISAQEQMDLPQGRRNKIGW